MNKEEFCLILLVMIVYIDHTMIVMHCDYDAETNSYLELFSHVNSF